MSSVCYGGNLPCFWLAGPILYFQFSSQKCHDGGTARWVAALTHKSPPASYTVSLYIVRQLPQKGTCLEVVTLFYMSGPFFVVVKDNLPAGSCSCHGLGKRSPRCTLSDPSRSPYLGG